MEIAFVCSYQAIYAGCPYLIHTGFLWRGLFGRFSVRHASLWARPWFLNQVQFIFWPQAGWASFGMGVQIRLPLASRLEVNGDYSVTVTCWFWCGCKLYQDCLNCGFYPYRCVYGCSSSRISRIANCFPLWAIRCIGPLCLQVRKGFFNGYASAWHQAIRG